jgi:type VI secretion system secreted protein VgrG
MEHPLLYNLEVGAFAFRVREIEGTEHLSQAWRLRVKFALDPHTMRGVPAAFDPDAVIKEEATISMERHDVPVRRLTGVVTEVELYASLSGFPEVDLVIEPRLALLKHRRDVRIHRNLTVPQIVTEVCQALGVKIDNRLQDAYPNRPYSVQWRETDYDYVMRLLEDEGIYYFFAEGDVMVLGDRSAGYDELPGGTALPFRHEAGANLQVDAVHRIGTRAAVTPGRVTLRDWNTEHPSLDMDVGHPTAVPFGPEWYDHPGEYEEPGEGQRKARLSAEAMDRAAAAVVGRSTCGRLYPGALFDLVDAPPGASGGRHVVRRIDHRWNDEETSFELSFEADPGDVVYRPPRTTYVPRIHNPHTGIVCTNGEDIQCDHFGRVKIHFHWDRLRPYDDDCSHWIPVLQDNTGGSSAIPRKGWEMVVHYLEGDPDRPIVVGRVYNGDDVFREKLPHAKDRSSLTSATSPTRDTANEIRFEDAAGLQRIFMRAPLDMNIRVAGDQTSRVGNNNTRVVENDESVQIGGNATWDIGGRCEPSVGNNQKWEVTGNRSKKVGKGDSCAVGGDHELKITGNHEQKVFADVNYGSDNLKETLKAGVTEKYKQKHTTEIGGEMTFSIGAAYEIKAKAGFTEQNTKDRTETIGAAHSVKADREIQQRCDRVRSTTVSGSLGGKCPNHLTLTGAQQMKMHSKTATWHADGELHLVVKNQESGNESYVSLKNGVFHIKAVNNVTIDISGSADQGASKSKQDGGS